MIKFDDITREKIKQHNPNYQQVSHHPYRILIAGVPGPGKRNGLVILISFQPGIAQIYLFAKNPYKVKR